MLTLFHCKPVILSDGLATINWQQATARARERIWGPGGVTVQHVSLQRIDLRRLPAITGRQRTEDAHGPGRLTSSISRCPVYSDQPDIFCSRSFGSATFRVIHVLSFAEGFKLRPFHGRVVKEQFAPFTIDEPKTLVRNQLFDRALWHTLNTP